MISSSSPINNKDSRFRRLVLLTTIIVYLLILAGGIVRSTGSGMGCPDWPRCFGRWVPPTSITQLPPNYQAIYGAKLKGEVIFNATKTWIEYVNRLLGVLAGLSVFVTLITSFSYVKRNKAVFWGSVCAFLLIGANGWLGSKVVSTELADYMITIHMLLAILVVFSLLFVYVRTDSAATKVRLTNGNKHLGSLVLLAIVISLGQIVLGTQVRDALDEIVRKLGYDQRNEWISQLNWPFYVHRSFSIIVFAVNLIIVYQIRKSSHVKNQLAIFLLLGIALEIITGVIMAYLGVPAFAQPVHLLLALVIIGIQFVIWLQLKSEPISARPSIIESGLMHT